MSPSPQTHAAAHRRHNDRRCVATGEALAPGAPALRFVRSPEGRAVADLAAKLPGRGAWVTPRRDLVALAAKRGFARAFKAETIVPGGPDAFAGEVGRLIGARALAGLGQARRAGQLVTGFEVVSKRASELSAYVTPEDASAEQTARVASRVAAAGPAPHLRLPTSAERLAGAIGEPAAVHVGLLAGKAGRAAAEAARIWAAYEGADLSR